MTDQEKMERIEALYATAVEIERCSQSPRIVNLHQQGRHCGVEIGITDPDTTKHLFVSLNPGADMILDELQNPQILARDHVSMAQYCQCSFPHARNMKKLLMAFATAKGHPLSEITPQFGATNLSIFHSKTSGALKESFAIECSESAPVLIQELSLPSLESVILSGVSEEHFRRYLQKAGAPILNTQRQDGFHDWLISFQTMLITGQVIKVLFMVHLSATRGLSCEQINSLGNRMAMII